MPILSREPERTALLLNIRGSQNLRRRSQKGLFVLKWMLQNRMHRIILWVSVCTIRCCIVSATLENSAKIVHHSIHIATISVFDMHPSIFFKKKYVIFMYPSSMLVRCCVLLFQLAQRIPLLAFSLKRLGCYFKELAKAKRYRMKKTYMSCALGK